MNTQKLYEFLVLSKALSYSKAASVLYISQSALSKHIREMEKELGTELFRRTTHGVSLTNAGTLLSQKAASLIDRCNEASRRIHLADVPLTGRIHIACVLELSYAAHIRVFISRFTEKYPDIDIDVTVLSEGTSEDMLNNMEYDFLFTPCEFINPPQGIQVHLIQSHGVFAALYPGHPLLSKSSIQLRELEGETIIVPFSHQLFGPYAKNWILVQKYTHNQATCRRAPNLPSALYEVQLGRGIALVPRYIKNLVSNTVFFTGISTDTCRFNEYLYYRESSENKAVQLFFEEFQKAFFHSL